MFIKEKTTRFICIKNNVLISLILLPVRVLLDIEEWTMFRGTAYSTISLDVEGWVISKVGAGAFPGQSEN